MAIDNLTERQKYKLLWMIGYHVPHGATCPPYCTGTEGIQFAEMVDLSQKGLVDHWFGPTDLLVDTVVWRLTKIGFMEALRYAMECADRRKRVHEAMRSRQDPREPHEDN